MNFHRRYEGSRPKRRSSRFSATGMPEMKTRRMKERMGEAAAKIPSQNGKPFRETYQAPVHSMISPK